ncbi:MAG: bis(5'-nucleosyl)-tetraphosphatase (symmetrical) YqeK [Endomicrobium sp.]|jgi:predicted HD superfamily hydrolase involved in NAD metabolism|uniref:bis(5'-nucleosyl)-tetraphosphatase (symmetrical) YqeK n=1 Tax=Candidatus Endomicrobiellum cubanum TaxID=3242325 RepID=UPI0028328450|nr:bis(5'-nucleosyl)-tetraphosphatase (symmetrical) YqeK [Endomicrobium sp.]
MSKNLEKQIFDYLCRHLSPARFEHSYNVAMLAIELALKHNAKVMSAQIAGLLHDCAKNVDVKKFISLLKKQKNARFFLNIYKFSPHLLHSFAGEIIAQKEFNIKDKDILNAIKNHTLGRTNMTKLEKIIFIADYCSKDRGSKYKDAKTIRSLAKENLDKAFIKVLKEKIRHLIYNDNWICPKAIDTWNFYVCKDK